MFMVLERILVSVYCCPVALATTHKYTHLFVPKILNFQSTMEQRIKNKAAILLTNKKLHIVFENNVVAGTETEKRLEAKAPAFYL